MSDRHPTMMEPPVEELLDRVDSKFTLVSLAAIRGRQINSYFNQLGEGLGTIVPPQVTSVSRKPLSISLEEIAAGKITYTPADADARSREDDRASDRSSRPGRPTNSTPASALARPAGSCWGCAAASPPTRPSRCAGAWSTPGAFVSPVLTRGADPVRRAGDVLGPGLRAGPHLAVGRARADPAHPARARPPI